jgi:DNA-binding transcriptional MerR regulator/methylmalonyl-CoA mutase cobalamin-binding subunit
MSHPDRVSGASIRVVSNRTGIQADTLRMWERRYGFPKPERTPGGARVYSEDDIERLLLVNRALAEGYRPSEVVALPRAELERMTSSSGVVAANASGVKLGAANASPVTVEAVTDALRRDDVEAVRALLRAGALTMGPKAFVTDLAHPLAVRIGELWQAGDLEVRHEHLASACLTTTLRMLLAAHEDGPRSPVVVLATMPNEPHALPLDMVAVYLAASLGAPRLLGADTPVDQIAAAAESFSADVVGISVSAAADRRAASRAAQRLAVLLPGDMPLWIGGAGAARLEAPNASVRKIASWDDLDIALAEARRGSRRNR